MKLQTNNGTIQLKSANPDIKVAEFISCLMSARNITHKLHLAVTGPGSYAKHVALNEFYDAIPGFADELAEKWQGYNQRILPLVPGHDESSYLSMSPQIYLRWVLNYIESNRTVFGANTMLQNIVDELVGQISSTIYKLTFLS